MSKKKRALEKNEKSQKTWVNLEKKRKEQLSMFSVNENFFFPNQLLLTQNLNQGYSRH